MKTPESPEVPAKQLVARVLGYVGAALVLVAVVVLVPLYCGVLNESSFGGVAAVVCLAGGVLGFALIGIARYLGWKDN